MGMYKQCLQLEFRNKLQTVNLRERGNLDDDEVDRKTKANYAGKELGR